MQKIKTKNTHTHKTQNGLSLSLSQHSLVEVHLHNGARHAQQKAHEIEHQHWTGGKHTLVHPRRGAMQQQVRVRAQRKLRTVLPRLQAAPEQQIVQRLPVVKRLVAVGDVRPEGGADARTKERLEGGIDARHNYVRPARRHRIAVDVKMRACPPDGNDIDENWQAEMSFISIFGRTCSEPFWTSYCARPSPLHRATLAA